MKVYFSISVIFNYEQTNRRTGWKGISTPKPSDLEISTEWTWNSKQVFVHFKDGGEVKNYRGKSVNTNQHNLSIPCICTTAWAGADIKCYERTIQLSTLLRLWSSKKHGYHKMHPKTGPPTAQIEAELTTLINAPSYLRAVFNASKRPSSCRFFVYNPLYPWPIYS